MTADKSLEMNGEAPTASARTRSASRKSPAKARGRGNAVKRAKTAAPARRKSATRSRSAKKPDNSYSGTATRLPSRGKKAAGTAYEWAAEGAGRALPLAARRLPDQRTVQKLVDERPYVLGAIGLGIGAIIGLMLPSPLSGSGSSSPSGRSGGRSRR